MATKGKRTGPGSTTQSLFDVCRFRRESERAGRAKIERELACNLGADREEGGWSIRCPHSNAVFGGMTWGEVSK